MIYSRAVERVGLFSPFYEIEASVVFGPFHRGSLPGPARGRLLDRFRSGSGTGMEFVDSGRDAHGDVHEIYGAICEFGANADAERPDAGDELRGAVRFVHSRFVG